MKKIIADTGATKSSWILVDGNNVIGQFETDGINVAVSGFDKLSEVLESQVVKSFPEADEIFLYTAGVVDETAGFECVKRLKALYPTAECFAFSDTMGAARACCGHNSGVVCILGTGSNTCLFDGVTLTSKIKSGGYILGDEGSGSYLGKRLLSDYLKGLMPEDLSAAMGQEYDLDYSSIVNAVYRSDKPGKYLADFSPFILKNSMHPWMNAFIRDCFRQFVHRNIYAYDKEYPVNFVGSIAWFYKEFLSDILSESGYILGKILRNPIDGLVEYHR